MDNLKRNNVLIEKELMESANFKQAHYIIGVDAYDKTNRAFCLTKIVDDKTEILLCKKMRNEEEFKQEIENLAKYFNADIIIET